MARPHQGNAKRHSTPSHDDGVERQVGAAPHVFLNCAATQCYCEVAAVASADLDWRRRRRTHGREGQEISSSATRIARLTERSTWITRRASLLSRNHVCLVKQVCRSRMHTEGRGGGGGGSVFRRKKRERKQVAPHVRGHGVAPLARTRLDSARAFSARTRADRELTPPPPGVPSREHKGCDGRRCDNRCEDSHARDEQLNLPAPAPTWQNAHRALRWRHRRSNERGWGRR